MVQLKMMKQTPRRRELWIIFWKGTYRLPIIDPGSRFGQDNRLFYSARKVFHTVVSEDFGFFFFCNTFAYSKSEKMRKVPVSSFLLRTIKSLPRKIRTASSIRRRAASMRMLLAWNDLSPRLANESFNGKSEDELPKEGKCCRLKETQVLIEQRRRHYDDIRPHG